VLDEPAGAVRRAAEQADDQHQRQQCLDDLRRSPPGKSTPDPGPGSGEAVPVSNLKTPFPRIWLLRCARVAGLLMRPAQEPHSADPYSLGVARAHLDKQPSDVRRMFDDVAKRYDVTNDVLSMGQDRGWRKAVLDASGAKRGDLVLDLAAGTGTSSEPFLRAGATVVPADFSLGMLQVGKQARPHLPFTAGDATKLPFADDVFDAVTISFGLRNVVDPLAGLREMRRVTRRGGRLVVCEFSHPTWSPLRTAYVEYLMRALPPIARAVSSSPDAYVYLAESIRAWPDQRGLADLIAEAGWARPQWRNLTGGIVALHRAIA
jgi:demethylmenaquinone methyltransferase/2-methoxy-6-polyprenyl-1,4-benzoquinol methylase